MRKSFLDSSPLRPQPNRRRGGRRPQVCHLLLFGCTLTQFKEVVTGTNWRALLTGVWCYPLPQLVFLSCFARYSKAQQVTIAAAARRVTSGFIWGRRLKLNMPLARRSGIAAGRCIRRPCLIQRPAAAIRRLTRSIWSCHRPHWYHALARERAARESGSLFCQPIPVSH